ncbi:MAG: hypothetical protein M1826_000603 [Phylliscum demangeonii]|nr:MAG: hypothetical protein M1826_000603 [Phylliscum demangeonii]
MPLLPRRFAPPPVTASPDPSVRSSLAPERRPYTGLPFSQSSSSPSAPGTPCRGRASAVGFVVPPPSSLPEVSALTAAVELSGLTLFEERALRAEAQDKANDVAVAHEKLRELHPRLQPMEKAAEELADLKAAAMTFTTQPAEAEARLRRQDQELQRLRARLRRAEQRANYHQRVHDEGENAAESAQAVLAEKPRLVEVEIESRKGKRLEDARAFVEKCRAGQAKVRELTEMVQSATGAYQEQIRLRSRVRELEKELEGRSTVSKRNYNRKVGDNLLLEEELRLLKARMEKLILADANRAAGAARVGGFAHEAW